MAPKLLSESAKSNPTALGDPVSLKAETSDTTPTEDDRSDRSRSSSRTDLDAVAPSPTDGELPKGHDQDSSKKTLKDLAKQDINEARKGNRPLLGDPVSLKAEKADKDPVKDDGFGGLTDNRMRDSKL